jgi:L-asparaginase
MKKILFVSTGGTFNKHYSPQTGEIAIDTQASTLGEIAQKWRCDFDIINIIGKDSLHMDDQDRVVLLETIQQSTYTDIIIIHGTDTMDLSAQVLHDAKLNRRIVLTGAMIPYRVDKVEATANIAMAIGYLQAEIATGVYISMNGVIGTFDKVIKNRTTHRFEFIPTL